MTEYHDPNTLRSMSLGAFARHLRLEHEDEEVARRLADAIEHYIRLDLEKTMARKGGER